MRTLLLSLVLLTPALVLGEGAEPRPKPEDYSAHVQAGEFIIGAEYQYRSFSADGKSYFVDKHLVVEVALYGPKRARLDVSAGQFMLRVNGKKRLLLPLAPQVIAYEMRWDDTGMTMAIGLGAGQVTLGGPEPGSRFPGDRRAPRSWPPQTEGTGVTSKEPQVNQGELMAERALPHGDKLLPVSGYLYFPYKKKTRSIKKLELLYQGPGGVTSLRLK